MKIKYRLFTALCLLCAGLSVTIFTRSNVGVLQETSVTQTFHVHHHPSHLSSSNRTETFSVNVPTSLERQRAIVETLHLDHENAAALFKLLNVPGHNHRDNLIATAQSTTEPAPSPSTKNPALSRKKKWDPEVTVLQRVVKEMSRFRGNAGYRRKSSNHLVLYTDTDR